MRRLRRAWRVLVVLTAAFVLPALPFRRRDAGGPARMRAALEQLGGAWVKLGQMLALRFDLLPAAYCDELFKLLNEVAPFPYAQVEAIVRQELGGAPDVVFRAFAAQPFAAASIGQVHRAVLPTGEPVAVKVQRPHIREQLRTDLDLMYAVARVLDWTHPLGATRSRPVVDEFARWTADELDYLIEARQAALLHEQARGARRERIARVYRAYTTSRVLTSELLEGIPLIEIVAAVRQGNGAYLRALTARGYDLQAVVRHLDWNMLNQVYVFGCFHADLHPANLYVLPGNAIGYVDFGIIGQLPEAVRASLTRYSWLLFQGDLEAAIRELMRWLAPSPATDIADARAGHATGQGSRRYQEQQARRARRLARYEAVCALHAEGTSLRAIARRLELAPGTVHRYLRAGAFPEQQPRPHQRTLLTPFEAELRARWDAGCHNGAALWRELRARGFRGGKAIVRERLARWRATDGAAPAGPGPARPGSAAAVPLPTYSVRQVTWQLLRGPEDLDADEHSFLEALCRHCPDLGVAHGLVQDFTTLVRQRQESALASWVAVATASQLRELASFAAGLLRDWAAVRAALTEPWSSGQVEGQVNKLKVLKRQMVGRANVDLLRKRVLYRGPVEPELHQMGL